jgi:anti-sigma28 factor (negative regulator of flagellin synthesis)
MKINDPNLTSAASAGAARPQGLEPTVLEKRPGGTPAIGSGAGDNVHLSELVKSLRALATESPERQAHLEQLARTYAQGNYKVDAEATAAGIIKDAQAG